MAWLPITLSGKLSDQVRSWGLAKNFQFDGKLQLTASSGTTGAVGTSPVVVTSFSLTYIQRAKNDRPSSQLVGSILAPSSSISSARALKTYSTSGSASTSPWSHECHVYSESHQTFLLQKIGNMTVLFCIYPTVVFKFVNWLHRFKNSVTTCFRFMMNKFIEIVREWS